MLIAAGALSLAAMTAGVSHSADPSPYGRGVFASFCEWSHSAHDDPIVHPGQAGAAHRHDFFGNTTTDAHSTGRSLRRGRGNCSIRADRAAYWTPSLYRGAEAIRPTRATAWYLKGGAGRGIRAFPRRLRMIAGDAQATRPQRAQIVNWSCADESPAASAAQTAGGRIPSCAYGGVRLRVSFPSCWDGRRRDSPDHKSHMAYRVWDRETASMRCPRSHPVAVPALILDVEYPLRDGDDVTLASGHVNTVHADFFNGWRQRALRRLTRRCLARSRPCGP